jgi:hypothetical protein
MRSLPLNDTMLNPKGDCGQSIVLKSETQGRRHPAYDGLVMEVWADPFVFISDSGERSRRTAP